MKFLKKTVVFAVVAATLIAACAGLISCGGDPEEDKGELLATYTGGEIYEKDITDWRNYMYHMYYSDIMSADDPKAELFNTLDRATNYVVKIKAFKALLESEGLVTFSEEKINQYAQVVISEIDESKTFASQGGYEYWKTVFEVSDDFIYEYAESQLVSAELERYIMSKYGVTDEMIQEYWELYAGEYLQVPSYYFDNIMVIVPLNLTGDASVWADAKAEAQRYIDELKAGADFETVKQEAIDNSRGTSMAKAYSTVVSRKKSEFSGFENLDKILEENKKIIDEYCANLGIELPEYANETDGKLYDAWYYYVNMNNEAYLKNQLLSLDIGEFSTEPIMHVFGYQIVKLTKEDDDIYFKSPFDYPEVYDDIYDKLYKELWSSGSGASVDEFEAFLAEKYDIKIVYSYASEYKKGNLK